MMTFITKGIGNLRLKAFVAAAACLAFVGCKSGQDTSVYRELLVEALWLEEIVSPGGGPEAFYYDFQDSGILTIYPVESKTIRPGTDHRFIYDHDNESLAIEGYGYFLTRDITTDRFVLSGSKKEIVLVRCREEVELPEKSSDKR